MTAQGVVPHVLDDQLHLAGTWTLLLGGVTLVASLVLAPDGIAAALRARLRPARRG
jgi:branched-chain amino acid transport system permease protein